MDCLNKIRLQKTYSLLKVGQLARSQSIRLADDWDHIDSGAQALHEFNIDFSQAIKKKKIKKMKKSSRLVGCRMVIN